MATKSKLMPFNHRSFLNDLSISETLALAVPLPVLGLLACSSFLIVERYQRKVEIGRVSKLIDFSRAALDIVAAAHQIIAASGQLAQRPETLSIIGRKFLDDLAAAKIHE